MNIHKHIVDFLPEAGKALLTYSDSIKAKKQRIEALEAEIHRINFEIMREDTILYGLIQDNYTAEEIFSAERNLFTYLTAPSGNDGNKK